jgi:hypothetical protein
MDLYILLCIFGRNIVASEGEEWKRYRKVAAPAFSEVSLKLGLSPGPEHGHQRNNKLVWDETNRIMMDLFDNVWGDRAEIVVDHCVDITLPVRFLCAHAFPLSEYLYQIALFVIGVAGSLYLVSIVLISCRWMVGFGREVTWTSDAVVPPGHQMTFKDTLHILSTNIILVVLVPDWAKNLTERTRKVHLAFSEMRVCDFVLSLLHTYH